MIKLKLSTYKKIKESFPHRTRFIFIVIFIKKKSKKGRFPPQPAPPAAAGVGCGEAPSEGRLSASAKPWSRKNTGESSYLEGEINI